MENRTRFLLGICIIFLLSLPSGLHAQAGPDSDGDGLADAVEDANGNGVLDAGETDPNNADTDNGGEADGIELESGRDPLDHKDDFTFDRDGDGLTNGQEFELRLNPKEPDTDGDGVIDGQDPFPNDQKYSKDSDGDGLPDLFERESGLGVNTTEDAEQDIDGDGLSNVQEFELGTSIDLTDSDGDGIVDGEDPFPTFIEYTGDLDKDGLPDEYEREQSLSPSDPSDAAKDPDGDGLSNLDEFIEGTDPFNEDTDRDGIPDGKEFEEGTDPLENPCLFYVSPAVTFLDTRDHWANAYVAHLHQTKVQPDSRRIVDGYEKEDGHYFAPDQHISRFEILKLALLTSCIAILDADQAEVTFSDIPTGRPHEDPDRTQRRRIIATAVQHQIVQGYEDGTFRSDQPVTRAEALKILSIATRLEQAEDTYSATAFNDVKDGQWFTSYIHTASLLEIVSGYEDGSFRPGAPITRAEAAKIVYRMMLMNPFVNGYDLPEVEK